MTIRTERYVSANTVAALRISAVVLPVIVFGVLRAGEGSGQESGAVTVDVTECVKLTSPAERLACFEAGVDDVLRERAPAAEPAAPSQPAPAPPAASSRAPAAPAESAPQPAHAEPVRARQVEQVQAAPQPARSARRGRNADDEDPTPTEIVGVIDELRETVPNSFVITLADGQVWRQTRAAPYPLTTGATVRIYQVERWGGSYRLTAVGRNGFIQVEPVR